MKANTSHIYQQSRAKETSGCRSSLNCHSEMSNREQIFQTNKPSQISGNSNTRGDIKYQQQIVANQVERKGYD